MQDIEIRFMCIADLDRVVQIEQDTFSRPWTKDNFKKSLEIEETIYLVAVIDKEVVGYCGLYQSFEEGNITNVAIDSKYRKRGIAKKMLSRLLALGEIAGITNFVLEVRVLNEPAICLYQKLGFHIEGTRKRFYVDPVEDAYIMIR